MHSRREAKPFGRDSERFISPFPGAYWTGTDAQRGPSTRFIAVLLALAAMLTGALFVMLMRHIP